MQLYQVGPASFDEYDIKDLPADRLVWVVYNYETAPYEGSGRAVGLRHDGLLEVSDLGHCSCYGPTDRWDGATMTVDDFLKQPESIHADDYSALWPKVRELMGL